MPIPISRPPRGRRRLLGVAAGLSAAALLPAGCAHPERIAAVPRGRTREATALGLPDERFFFLSGGEAVDRAFLAAVERERIVRGLPPGVPLPRANLLAVSGGGEDGAFGAGLLCGWTETGTRPVFNLVTGVSTGALTAPFAFLGPRYDAALKDVYTNITIRDVAEARGLLRVPFDESVADTSPLFRTISRHLDEAMLDAIAEAYRGGRLLLIGTTNLDAQVPVVWNIGAIAASGHPRALDLVRRLLLASAAVPGAFPPVMIDVELDGQRHQEMHVDGGAFAQAFLYPRAVGEARQARQRGGVRVREVDAWVLRNARLDPNWASVDRRVFGIVGRSISTMIFTSGFNDVVRMYEATQRDGVDYNLAFIGSDFTTELKAPFDQTYMRALFDYGYALGRRGYSWAKRPPVGGSAPAPTVPG